MWLFLADEGTILGYVSGEEPNGSDGWIHAGCDVFDAKIGREYGWV